MKRHAKRSNTALGMLFGLYCGLMLWLLFDRSVNAVEGLSYRENLRLNINLVPLFTIRNYLHVILRRTNDAMLVHCSVNLLGNVLLFIPAGCLLPRLWQKQRSFFRFFFTGLGAILTVEVMQLFTLLGSFDVDDIILNLAGMLIGFILFHICTKPSARK